MRGFRTRRRAALLCLIFALLPVLTGCGRTNVPYEAGETATTEVPFGTSAEAVSGAAGEGDGGEARTGVTGSMDLQYATQFTVDYLEGGCALVTVGGTDIFLVVPEGAEAPVTDAAVTIHLPLDSIYNAASSAMDLFVQLGSLDRVAFTSTTLANWGIPEVCVAMESGALRYAGRYSAPDYELLLSSGCGLAVESTMIYHTPETREKLEDLGIPVLVERSSYEPEPLGRVEWIKLYGLLLGREAEAEAFFADQVRQLDSLDITPAAEQTVAFFHLNTAGAAVVRKPGDYVSKMIALAGGRYVFEDLPGADENALSTMNMQLEAFYAGARDADVLIYNSTIDGELETLDQLLAKSSLLADFKAVQSGNVWCSEHNMFQKSSAAAGMIRDLNAILTGAEEDAGQLTFFHRLK